MKVMHNLAFLIFLLAGKGLFSQSNITICSNVNKSFQGGEKLVYELYYHWNFIWISAGTLEMAVVEKPEAYVLTATGKTHQSYNWFFKVHDVFISEMEKKTLKPRKFSRNIEEGNYILRNEIFFNPETDKVTSSVRINNGKTTTYRFDNTECLLDILALAYNLRNINFNRLAKEKIIYSDLVFDEKIYKIPIKYRGKAKDMKVSGLGKVDVVKISPDLIAGNVFNEGSAMMIYVTDDQNKIPVMIESPIKVGSVKAILRSWENLKHPFRVIKSK